MGEKRGGVGAWLFIGWEWGGAFIVHKRRGDNCVGDGEVTLKNWSPAKGERKRGKATLIRVNC